MCVSLIPLTHFFLLVIVVVLAFRFLSICADFLPPEHDFKTPLRPSVECTLLLLAGFTFCSTSLDDGHVFPLTLTSIVKVVVHIL